MLRGDRPLGRSILGVRVEKGEGAPDIPGMSEPLIQERAWSGG